MQAFLEKKIKVSGRWQLIEKKLQQIVKMGKTTTISSYFSKHSGSQNPYVKNYAEKKCKYVKNRKCFKFNFPLNCK